MYACEVIELNAFLPHPLHQLRHDKTNCCGTEHVMQQQQQQQQQQQLRCNILNCSYYSSNIIYCFVPNFVKLCADLLLCCDSNALGPTVKDYS